jgi:hypothetical protein
MACGVVASGLVIEYKSEFLRAITERRIKLLPLGAFLVTFGVALEFVFQIRTSVLVSEVRGIQQKETSDANERVAKAENNTSAALERAAKADKAAAEAKLALVKLKKDRIIEPENVRKLVAELLPYAGKRFWIITEVNGVPGGSEQERLADQITQIFLTAKWKKDDHITKNEPDKVDPPTSTVGDRGCAVVVAADSHLQDIEMLVIEELTKSDIDCTVLVPDGTLASDVMQFGIALR